MTAAQSTFYPQFPNYGASSRHDPLLSLGSALAVGGLLGDVFLHTLPDSFAEAKEEDGGAEGVGTRCLVGFLLFLLMDIFMRSVQGGHSHHNDKGDNHKHGSKKSVILLNLVGDAMHNFSKCPRLRVSVFHTALTPLIVTDPHNRNYSADGIAIGASFAASDVENANQSIISLVTSKGGLASISVFLHEVPHELCDFATLVNAGLSRNHAVMCQFLTALGAFLGTAAGLFAGSLVDGLGHDFLLPFTAGGFVYLACVTILPEILDADASVPLRLMQIGSFLVGLGFMYGVLIVEEWEGSGHTHGSDEL